MLRLGLAFLILMMALGGVAAYGVDRFHRPGLNGEAVTLVIPRGEGVAAMTRRFKAAGILENGFLFRLGVRLSGTDRVLKAGEYAFPPFASPAALMEILKAGETVQRKFTLAEGLTTAQVLALLETAEGLEGRIPDLPPEGAFLPETYAYVWGETKAALIARMRGAMTRTLGELWDGRKAGLPLVSPQEALILASLVEKETALAEERPRVAAVFLNRLKRGMRLQADPTVVYALLRRQGNLARPLDRALTRADLEMDDPYNTYRVAGMPPGPIANPGRAAIAAVLQPVVTDELYFVADGNGGHLFARSLKAHLKNVRCFRRSRKK